MMPSPLAGALERIRPHDHLCSLYERHEERIAAAVPFICIGLGRGEKCVYVGDDGSDEVLRRALQAGGADVERLTDTGALVLCATEQAYPRCGHFEPDAMLDFWREQAAQAAGAGFAAMRGAGETDWLLRGMQDVERWMEYEDKLTEVMLGCSCLVLCQYDCRLHPPETILGVIRTHPLVIFDGAVCANHYYVQRQELLRGSRAEHEVSRLLGSLRDRERAEARVRETNAALRRSQAQLIEGQRISHNGSWSWNAASGELFWSAEHFRIWGLDPAQAHPTAAEAVGMAHPEDQARMWRAWEEATGARKEYECEFRVIHPNGVIRHVHSLGHPRLDGSGALVEYIGTVMDVTERKRAAEDLHKAREDLARVNRVLTVGELTASIAHELSQPLAAVIINANAGERWLAAARPNIPEASDALRHISRDANRASEVISRIRALLMKSSTRRVDLGIDEIVRDVASLVQGQAAAQNVTMLIEIEPELPRLLADRVQVQQLVLNLVLNALESMSAVAGKRALILRASRREPGEVLVSVRDTGTGVSPQHMEQVFDAFFTTKADGMGMGLAISRSIVEAHNGRLWAAHNEGPGATFQFTLPVPPRQ